MNSAITAIAAADHLPADAPTTARPMSMRLTLAVWAVASIGGWGLVLLALLPLLQ